jgi:type II secretory pathway pseudopilin PulG
MQKFGYSLIEILGVIALVLTLSVVAIPSLRNFSEGSKQGVAVRNAAALNSAVQQYDQRGGLLTARVPVPDNVASIRNTALLPELAVLNYLRSNDSLAGQVSAWQEPIFDDKGYRVVWVNRINESQEINRGLGGDRNELAENLSSSGEGARFEVIGPDEQGTRLGIVGFQQGNLLIAALSTPTPSLFASTTAVLSPTPRPTTSAITPTSTPNILSPTPSPSPSPRLSPIPVLSPTPAIVTTQAGNRAPIILVGASRLTPARKEVINFTVTGRDPDGDALVYRYRINMGEWSNFAMPTLPPSATSPGGSLRFSRTFDRLGVQRVEAQARDRWGALSPVSTVNIVVSNRLPSITLASSKPAAARGENITFTATATDPDGDALQYRFRAPGMTLTGTGSTETGGWTPFSTGRAIAIRFSTGGEKKIEVQARDAMGGLSTVASTTVNVANRGPSVSLSANPASATTRQTITFTATAADPDGDQVQYRYRIPERSFTGGTEDGWTPFYTGNSISSRFNTTGSKKIEVQVRDTGGALSPVASVTVDIINRAPTVSLNASASSIATRQDVTFTAVGSDPDGDPLQYKFRIPETTFTGGSDDGWSPFTTARTITRRFVGKGTKTIEVQARDSAGQVSPIATVQVEVTNRAPTANVFASSPIATRGQDVTFLATGSDPDGDALEYRFRIPEMVFAGGSADGWTPFSVTRIITSKFADRGVKKIEAQARDSSGALSPVVSVNVDIINRAPTVTLAAQPTSPAIGKTVLFTALGRDPDQDPLQYSFNGGAYSSNNTFSTSFAAPGNQTVTVKAKDSLGAESAPATVTVVVGNFSTQVPPTLVQDYTEALYKQIIVQMRGNLEADVREHFPRQQAQVGIALQHINTLLNQPAYRDRLTDEQKQTLQTFQSRWRQTIQPFQVYVQANNNTYWLLVALYQMEQKFLNDYFAFADGADAGGLKGTDGSRLVNIVINVGNDPVWNWWRNQQ